MNLSNLDHKDVWIRAGKTFVAAFVAAISTSDFLHANLSNGKQIFLAAAGAGVTALWNYLLQVSRS